MSTLTLPSRHDEAWRWSDLSPLPELAAARPDPGARWHDLPWIDVPGPRLAFIDGAYAAELSDPGGIGIAAAPLRPDQALARIAADRATAGYTLSLGRDEAAGGLIQIIYADSGGAAYFANRIALAENAQASLVETFIGAGWSNAATEVDLAPRSRLMRALRVLKAGGAHSDYVSGRAAEGASYVSTALVAGCDTARAETQFSLVAPGAYVEAGGALLARGEERLEGVNVIRHDAPEGVSRQLWRLVADGQAATSVSARVEVARDAQKTDGEQSLKGIMLSRAATINLKPELEIFADDVKCAHGATVGELDRRALFYLASRGVSPEEAEALLTRAFVADALDRIGEDAVREAFYADVERWFSAEGRDTPFTFVPSEVEGRL